MNEVQEEKDEASDTIRQDKIRRSKTKKNEINRRCRRRMMMTSHLLGWPTPKDLLRTNPSSRNESARLPPGFLITWKERRGEERREKCREKEKRGKREW